MCRIRKRFKDVCKNVRFSAKKAEIIGCSPSELKNHIESQFTAEMNWKNYGKFFWEMDHIIPVSVLIKYPDKLHLVFNYRNHAPLSMKENSAKWHFLDKAKVALQSKIDKFGSDSVYEEMMAFLDSLLSKGKVKATD